MPFESIERTKIRSQVLTQIAEAIRKGEYKEGSKLPSERKIAREIAVSRHTVREAFGILAAVGVIKRRPGDGTYVSCAEEWALEEALSAERQSEKKFEDIFELQQLLEPAVACLAIEKRSEEDLVKIKKAFGSMEEAVEKGDRDLYSKSDRLFHLNIAKATANWLVVKQVRDLVDAMNEAAWRGLKKYGVDPEIESSYLRKSLSAHRKLYRAIAEKDKESARKVLRRHYHEVKKEIQK